MRETHPPCCVFKSYKELILHKNLLFVDNVDTSRESFERVAHFLSVEVVNRNREVVCASRNLVDASDVLLGHIAIVVEVEIVEDCPVAVTHSRGTDSEQLGKATTYLLHDRSFAHAEYDGGGKGQRVGTLYLESLFGLHPL